MQQKKIVDIFNQNYSRSIVEEYAFARKSRPNIKFNTYIYKY